MTTCNRHGCTNAVPAETQDKGGVYCSPACRRRAAADRKRSQRHAAREFVTCQECGGSLLDLQPSAKFCCGACAKKYHNRIGRARRATSQPDQLRICARCGTELTGQRSQVYCSSRCKQAAKYTRKRAPMPTAPAPAQPSNWGSLGEFNTARGRAFRKGEQARIDAVVAEALARDAAGYVPNEQAPLRRGGGPVKCRKVG